MENENYVASPYHKLLVMEKENPWQTSKSHRGRKIFTFENAVKVFIFLTIVSACFTSVASAIYSYHNLNRVQVLHREILDVESTTQNNKAVQSPPESAAVTSPETDTDDVDNDDDFGVDDTDDDSYDSDDEWFDEDYDNNEYDDDDEYDDEYDDDYDDDDGYDIDDEPTGLDESIEEGSGFFSDDEDYGRVRRSPDNKTDKKGRKGGKGGKSNNRKQQKTRKGGSKGKQKKLKSLPTAQFHANITEADLEKIGMAYNSYAEVPDCGYSIEMGGVYCLNQTFMPDSRKPLNLFKKEEWVDNKKSPVKEQDRKFVVQNDGTHLVYAQLLMEANQPTVSASVIRERKDSEDQWLTCTNACINSNPNSTDNFRCTCSIFGLMNLKTNDVLFVQVPERDNNIILDQKSTYMGIVQLNRDK